MYVDWGPEFYAQHLLAFPSFSGCALSVNIGWLGLNQIRATGGSGHFPLRMVREDESAGRLHRVPGVPEFRLPASRVCVLPREDRFAGATTGARVHAARGLRRGVAIHRGTRFDAYEFFAFRLIAWRLLS